MGTLNLCLKVPDKMQKTRGESDYSRLPKNYFTLQKLNLVNLFQLLYVFSVLDNWIDFKSFATV